MDKLKKSCRTVDKRHIVIAVDVVVLFAENVRERQKRPVIFQPANLFIQLFSVVTESVLSEKVVVLSVHSMVVALDPAE